MKGLFNSAVYGLVREVQERLDDVFVTYALSSAGSPDLRDAMTAARFARCDSAVVVHARGGESFQPEEYLSKGDWMLAPSTQISEMDAPAVVDAFHAALASANRAA